jgi:O-antigen chain-terminating methyltransferase
LRGSSDEIRDAQQYYVSFFPTPEGSGKVVDLGCGRGEFLELLLKAGYDVLGVDPDPDMVEVCRSKNLPVIQNDAIHYLESAEDDSMRGIFCAQVVEHMLTSEIELMIELARQKLLKHGVLVMETINPRSLHALGNHFFADTTHVRPVHPETLRFICEQVGFETVELAERSAHPAMATREDLPAGPLGEAVDSLIQSVFGYQDYVIVATK